VKRAVQPTVVGQVKASSAHGAIGFFVVQFGGSGRVSQIFSFATHETVSTSRNGSILSSRTNTTVGLFVMQQTIHSIVHQMLADSAVGAGR
jgi:hypothetical protein